MRKVKITVVKKVFHKDLSKKYENIIEHSCDLNEGDSFISFDGNIPEGFCPEAWKPSENLQIDSLMGKKTSLKGG